MEKKVLRYTESEFITLLESMVKKVNSTNQKKSLNELDKSTWDSASEKARNDKKPGLADKFDAHSKERYGNSDTDILTKTPEEKFNGSISFDVRFWTEKKVYEIKTFLLSNLTFKKGGDTIVRGVDANGKSHSLWVNEPWGVHPVKTFYGGDWIALPSTIKDAKNYIKYLNDNGMDTKETTPKQITSGYGSWKD